MSCSPERLQRDLHPPSLYPVDRISWSSRPRHRLCSQILRPCWPHVVHLLRTGISVPWYLSKPTTTLNLLFFKTASFSDRPEGILVICSFVSVFALRSLRKNCESGERRRRVAVDGELECLSSGGWDGAPRRFFETYPWATYTWRWIPVADFRRSIRDLHGDDEWFRWSECLLPPLQILEL